MARGGRGGRGGRARGGSRASAATHVNRQRNTGSDAVLTAKAPPMLTYSGGIGGLPAPKSGAKGGGGNVEGDKPKAGPVVNVTKARKGRAVYVGPGSKGA